MELARCSPTHHSRSSRPDRSEPILPKAHPSHGISNGIPHGKRICPLSIPLHCLITPRMASFGRSRNRAQFSVPSSPSDAGSPIRPRRPSLDLQGDILSTRGQYLSSLLRRRSFSSQSLLDLDRDESLPSFRDWLERPASARARELIGDREGKPSYNW